MTGPRCSHDIGNLSLGSSCILFLYWHFSQAVLCVGGNMATNALWFIFYQVNTRVLPLSVCFLLSVFSFLLLNHSTQKPLTEIEQAKRLHCGQGWEAEMVQSRVLDPVGVRRASQRESGLCRVLESKGVNESIQ